MWIGVLLAEVAPSCINTPPTFVVTDPACSSYSLKWQLEIYEPQHETKISRDEITVLKASEVNIKHGRALCCKHSASITTQLLTQPQILLENFQGNQEFDFLMLSTF